MKNTQTQFGFKTASPEERDREVQQVFSSVASRYDVMNDVMSGGLHRLWKDRMVSQIHRAKNLRVLDVAGGTGDIAFRIYEKLFVLRSSFFDANNEQPTTNNAQITVCDRNPEMLAEGRARAINRGIQGVTWQEGDAQALPFADNQFDYYTIAFGLRNVTRLQDGLLEAFRVLKPGGRFLCLEFSPEVGPEIIRRFYDLYSFKVIPYVGEKITGDREAYQYLIESIRVFPAPDALVGLMAQAGFSRCRYEKMSFGVVCLHSGYKI